MLGIDVSLSQLTDAIGSFWAIPAVPVLAAAVLGLGIATEVIRALYSLVSRR